MLITTKTSIYCAIAIAIASWRKMFKIYHMSKITELDVGINQQTGNNSMKELLKTFLLQDVKTSCFFYVHQMVMASMVSQATLILT